MNKEYQDWISSLEKKIIEEEDKVIFSEIVRCIENECFRAAYLLSWIAVIESLKRKISKYSSLGDKNAETAVNKIEETEKLKNSTDKLIFELSKDCGIIDENESTIIQFLWEQRCIFAHPYEKQPDLEEVNFIIDQAIKISLGRQLLINKTYIEDLCTNISEKPFFLQNDGEQIKEYSKKIIARTPASLFPFFFKTFLFKIGSIIHDDTKTYEQIKLRYFIIELFSNTRKDLGDDDWGLEFRATKFPYESFLGYVCPAVWVKMPMRIKDILISYFEFEQNESRLNILKTITRNLVKEDVLENKFRTRFYKILNDQKFEYAIDYYGDSKVAFKRITDVLETNSYDLQNPVIDFLERDTSITLINGLDSEKQFLLGRLVATAASNNHWKSQYLVNNIIKNSLKYSDFVKAGISLNYVLSISNFLRLDYSNFKAFFEIANTLVVEAYNKVFEILESYLDTNPADDFDIITFDEELFKTNAAKILVGIEWKSDDIKNRSETLCIKIKDYFTKQGQ